MRKRQIIKRICLLPTCLQNLMNLLGTLFFLLIVCKFKKVTRPCLSPKNQTHSFCQKTNKLFQQSYLNCQEHTQVVLQILTALRGEVLRRWKNEFIPSRSQSKHTKKLRSKRIPRSLTRLLKKIFLSQTWLSEKISLRKWKNSGKIAPGKRSVSGSTT